MIADVLIPRSRRHRLHHRRRLGMVAIKSSLLLPVKDVR